MKRYFFLLIFCFPLCSLVWAQHPRNTEYLPGILIGNDTLPHQDLPSVTVFPRKKFNNKRDEQQYWRMVMRVKKVWPYAKEAALLMEKFEKEVPPGSKAKDRRVYVRQAEDELMKKYGETLKKFSITDGRVLIKLIDRETHRVSYDLIHDLKGGVPAVFWQGIARIFGNNLKSRYEPTGEDRMIEQIIQAIEMGII